MRLTMKDVRRINKENGYYFFSEDTMRFWGTSLVTELFPNNTFVTADDNFDRTKKMYTVRFFNEETGVIKTVCGFQKYETLEDAVKAAKGYVEDGEDE